jgi:hypothetical protein
MTRHVLVWMIQPFWCKPPAGPATSAVWSLVASAHLTWRCWAYSGKISYKFYTVIERLHGNCKRVSDVAAGNGGRNCSIWPSRQLHLAQAPRQEAFGCIFSLRFRQFRHTRNESGRSRGILSSFVRSVIRVHTVTTHATDWLKAKFTSHASICGHILRLRFTLWKRIAGDLYVPYGANACSFLEVKMHVIFVSQVHAQPS